MCECGLFTVFWSLSALLHCTFPLVQETAGRNPQQTHNLYTQVLAETGIQGAVCFAVFILLLMKKTRQVKKGFEERLTSLLTLKDKDPSLANSASYNEETLSCQFLLLVSKGLHVFIITRLALGVFGHDLLEIYWWVAAGLVMSLTNILKRMEITC